jgi:hypothetical protein
MNTRAADQQVRPEISPGDRLLTVVSSTTAPAGRGG